MEKFRARNFNLVLYDEDETHKSAIDFIQKNYDYAIILHDKDVDKYGEIKKPHYHIVIRFKNAKWSSSLAEELGITENYIEECRSLKSSLLYLIHFYDEDKYQYPLTDVQGSLKNRLYEIVKNDEKTETEKYMDLIQYIDGIDEFITLRQFITYCVSIGYTSAMRMNFNTLRYYIEEHNDEYRN